MFFTLGPDWFLLFLQGHIHSSTVSLVLRLFVYFLSNPSILATFKQGVTSGTLVENMEMLLGIIGTITHLICFLHLESSNMEKINQCVKENLLYVVEQIQK